VTASRTLRGLAPVFAFLVAGVCVLVGVVPWRCPLFLLTGIPCPTCGMTRAARFALHGDFGAATRMHPLWFLVLPACLAVGAAEAVAYARTGEWGRVIERRAVAWGLSVIAIALVAVWVARFAGACGGPAGGE
jgi:hypothetical protein